jgi:hypothetical protein
MNETIVTLLSVMVTLLAGGLGLLVRITAKWTKHEDRITQVAADLQRQIIDADRVHQEIIRNIREDRRATNERLTWLERHLWQRGA